MSDKYPADVKLDENPDGSVSFATGVVETIAGLAAQEVEGVASMASASTGFADMFTRKSTRNFTKGVRVEIDGGVVAVDVTIVVEYGSPVPDVARSIQENVKKAIETMSGLDVRNVDVHVQGVSFCLLYTSFAAEADFPVAVFQPGHRVAFAVPAVEIANEVHLVRAGRPLAVHPAVVRARDAVVKITVCKRGKVGLVAEQGAARVRVALHAQGDVAIIGFEPRVDREDLILRLFRGTAFHEVTSA